MSGIGTDAAALRRRILAHDRFAERDINEWILGATQPRPGERVLDVGCGTGKQLIPIARLVDERGLGVGLDYSAAALAAARESLAVEGLGNVRLVRASMEQLPLTLGGAAGFDLATFCFSLYYSHAPLETLREVRSLLRPGGRGFVCGPAPGNNREFLALCDGVAPRAEQVHRDDASLAFMDESAPRLCGELFERVVRLEFENPVVFPAPEDVFDYWRSYHLYAPGREAAFREALRVHFAAHGSFVTRKRVRGVLVS